MTKKLPILRRLEVALSETTSATEKDEVYGLLGRYCSRIDCNGITIDKLYEGINHKTFSPIENRRIVDCESIKNGKILAKYLKNAVNLPQIGERGYRTKMLKAREMEFEAFNNLYCLKDETTN